MPAASDRKEAVPTEYQNTLKGGCATNLVLARPIGEVFVYSNLSFDRLRHEAELDLS
jgi:hypothetical protein